MYSHCNWFCLSQFEGNNKGKFIMQVQQFLQQLFQPSPNYYLQCAVAKLRAYGGISSLLNSFKIDHRQITDIYKHHKIYSFPSANSLSLPERAKKVAKKQPQLQNILLYLITLSFFVKLLLFDNELQSQLNIYSEVISFLFLIFIIAEKKSRTNSEIVERMPEESDDQKRFKVRRNGYEHYLSNEEIAQGDIILIQEGDFFKFDAIVLEITESSSERNDKDCAYVTINEEEVGSGRSKCKKNTVWKVELFQQQSPQHHQDPFLLANSKMVGGSAWALVCLAAKGGPSKRTNSQIELGGILKLSNLSHQVEQVIRVAVVVLVGYLSMVWLSVESINPYDIFLQLIYLISCLTLYLSYANTSEFLSCLKKYLKQKINGQGYRILNHKLLQKLGEIDLIIVEDDCLTKNIELLSKINHLIDLKIVTRSTQKQLQARFGGDLNHQLIFQPTDNQILRSTLNQLSRSKFISISYQQFRRYYLEILRDLQYCMVYMSRSRAAIGKYDDIITIKCSDMEGVSEERLQGEWIRISQGVTAELVFLDIMEKARVYKRFQQSFYAIVINNCFELLMLIGWALTGCLVDLNLNLLVVFINRNRVKQFYQAISEERQSVSRVRTKTRWLSLPVEVNLIFMVYYIYMSWEIAHSTNREFQLFLLLMTNRMFRIEALLRQKYHTGLIYRLLNKSLFIFVLIILEAVVKWKLGDNSDFISESLDILLLPLILLLFALFL